MNREQRRQYTKGLKKMGANKNEIMRYNEILKLSTDLKEGDKVRLNYEKIINQQGYDKRTEKYRSFIESNKDKIFTVEYDEKMKSSPNCIFVSLFEDNTQPKWLWYIDDLIKVEE